MAKGLPFSDHSIRVSKRDHDRSNIDELLKSLLAVSDSGLIEASFDGLFDSTPTDSDQNDLIQHAFNLGSVILEASKRSVRKRSSVHNASIWPLSPDLTIKVFSTLDTPSVCSAAATCSFFQKCAMDPLCYASIDLTSSVFKVNDAVVTKFIQRAGNALQSIKLGVQPPNYGNECEFIRRLMLYSHEEESTILTNSCLSSLSANGSCLRRLHLYNIESIDNISLFASLSVCPSLIDLEIVCLDVEINDTLESVSSYCRLIERFIYQSNKVKVEILQALACKNFVLNCPKITTLALKACRLHDHEAHKLVKGFHELKYLDFTESAVFTGAFLKNLGTKGGGNNLEVMILRDCYNLDKVEVRKFMKALLAGKFSLLRHLDISNKNYNGSRNGVRRGGSSLLTFLCEIFSCQLLRERPNFCLVAEFPNKR